MPENTLVVQEPDEDRGKGGRLNSAFKAEQERSCCVKGKTSSQLWGLRANSSVPNVPVESGRLQGLREGKAQSSGSPSLTWSHSASPFSLHSHLFPLAPSPLSLFLPHLALTQWTCIHTCARAWVWIHYSYFFLNPHRFKESSKNNWCTLIITTLTQAHLFVCECILVLMSYPGTHSLVLTLWFKCL